MASRYLVVLGPLSIVEGAHTLTGQRLRSPVVDEMSEILQTDEAHPDAIKLRPVFRIGMVVFGRYQGEGWPFSRCLPHGRPIADGATTGRVS